MPYGLQFGSYVFQPGFHIASVEMAREVPAAKLPRADGARVIPGYLDAKKISVRGGVYHASLSTGSPGQTVRAQLDALKGALAQGPAPFYTDSDRYYRLMQSSSYSDSWDPTDFNRMCTVSFDLIGPDPFSYEVAAQSPSRTITASGQSLSVTNGGNAYALPQFQITAGATGTLNATITNTTTGESFTFNGPVTAGNVILVDSLNEAVSIGGTDNTQFFDGLFPRLLPGANTITESYTLGSISNLALSWNNRWF